MKISISNKILILFFSVIGVSITLIGWHGYKSAKDAYIELAYKLSAEQTRDLVYKTEAELAPILTDVAVVANSYSVYRYMIWKNLKVDKKTKRWKQVFSDSLLDLLSTKQKYFQLRVFDLDANELITAVYDVKTKKANLTENSKLQNKAGRKYIEVTKKIEKDKFYISELNLNVERGVIELPHRAVLRYATPLINENNELLGLFVASFSANILFDIIKDIEARHKKDGIKLFLIDKNSNYIYNKNINKRWNVQLNNGHQFKKDYFDIIDSTVDEDVFIKDDKIYSYKKVYPSPIHGSDFWYVVSVVDTKIALIKLKDFQLLFILVIIGIILISFFVIKKYISLVINPLEKVTKQLKALAVGSVLKQNITYDSNDEIGDIVHSTARVVSAIEATIEQANAVSDGDFSSEVKLLSNEDKLGLAIRSMTKRLSDISRHANSIANGDFSNKIEVKSKYDKLGTSLLVMNDTLKATKYKNDSDIWFSKGISDFSDNLTSIHDLDKLLVVALNTICEHINASAGVLYKTTDKNHLEYKTSYVFDVEDQKNKIKFGDGLIGQVAFTKKEIHMNTGKDNSIVLKSSFGDIEIQDIFIVPLLHEDNVYGVIELRNINKFDDLQTRYIKRVTEILAVIMENISKNAQIEALLEESELAYKELHSASEYKSEFLANMSHELRTPLNSIILLSKLLVNNPNKSIEKDDVSKISVINKAGNDLLLLINDILDLSKIESGNIIIDEEVIYSGEITQEIEGLFDVVAKDKGIELIVRDEYNSTLLIDDTKLLQVVKNLLSNSFKFTKDGSVEFSIKQDKQNIIFEVSDTGIGMPQEKLSLIFEAFKQVDGSISRKYGGTGLGLSISKNFIDMMGGEIIVSSIEGKGSSFKVVLPLKKGDNTHAKSDAKSAKNSAPEPTATIKQEDDATTDTSDEIKTDVEADVEADIEIDPEMFLDKNILIVDDDSRNIFTLSAILQDYGVNVSTALDGKQAIELIDEEEIDIVLMDMLMPVMDGIEAIKDIRSHEKYNDMPIIVITANTSSTAEKLCFDAGADDFMHKPIDIKLLIEKLKTKIL